MMMFNEALCMARLLHQQTPGLASKQHCQKREKWPKNWHLLRKQRGEMREVGEDLPFQDHLHYRHKSTQHPEQALGNEIPSFHQGIKPISWRPQQPGWAFLGKERVGTSSGRQRAGRVESLVSSSASNILFASYQLLIVTNHRGTDWAQQGSGKIDNFSQASKIHERGGGPVAPLLCCSLAQILPWRAKISGVILFSWAQNTFGWLTYSLRFRRVLSEGPGARLSPRVVN